MCNSQDGLASLLARHLTAEAPAAPRSPVSLEDKTIDRGGIPEVVESFSDTPAMNA
jgi:hypothetical protein